MKLNLQKGISGVVVVIMIAAIALVAVGVFMMMPQKDSVDSDNTAVPTEEVNAGSEEASQPDDIQIEIGGDMTANMKQTKDGEEVFTAQVKYDEGKGMAMKSQTPEGEMEGIFIENFYYIKSPDGKWTRLPFDANALGINPQEYVVSEADIDEWKSKAVYVRTEACPNSSNTCDFYNVAVEPDGLSKVYIDTTTHRVDRVIHSVGEYDVTQIDYDYSQEINIEAPQV